MVLRMLRWSRLSQAERAELVERDLGRSISPELRHQVGELIEDVRERGDLAVCDALARFDGVDVEPDGLRVGDEEWEAAQAFPDDGLRAAIAEMVGRIRRFNTELLARRGDWQFEAEPGLTVGEKVTPIASAGLFCPSGKASYPSVLAQLGGPAVVAGVPEIVVVVPPKPGTGGRVDPVVLAVAGQLGLREVFRANGPAGVAAMAFGTERIPKVVKVVGPGSWPVTVAQIEVQRWGTATMMALGPTESVVVADASADPVRLAADLLIEAEHGTDSCTLLVTTCAELAASTDAELATQIAELPAARTQAAAASLGVNGGCVLVDSLVEAAEVVNAFAPEHLQLVVRADAEADVLGRILHAGEILLGQDTPFSAANFVIGCPASLPTNGFARVSSGITAEAFVKRTAVARADSAALARMAPSVLALADVEGFPAHAAALRRRFPHL
ncbi:MAG: histidinol dehydrogenase [Ilumatobacteraceae bacterium]